MKKKVLLTVLALLMMAGFAMAQTTVNFSGFIRVYPEINNYGYGKITLSDDSQTRAFVDQRARIFFKLKSGENVGGTYAMEIDSRWGDVAYNVGRNKGGALEADSVNVETKNAFLWFKPTAASKFTVGIQGFKDDFMGIILGGADMAGIRADYNLTKDSSLMAGWFLFSDKNVQVNDGIYFIPVTFKHKMGNNTLSLSLYGLFDDGGQSGERLSIAGAAERDLNYNLTYIANGSISPKTNLNTISSYQRARVYYGGVNFSGKSGNVAYTLFGLYNWGTINGYAPAPVTPTSRRMNMDISAYALHAMADVAMGAGTLRGRALYVSGGDKNPEAFNGMVTGNQYSTGADLPLLCSDLYILVRTSEDITHSVALLPDVNNNGRGVFLIYADYNHKITDKTSFQLGAGYMQANDNRRDIGKHAGMLMGTEINAKLKYMLQKNMSITGVLAWADLGDYYNDHIPAPSTTAVIHPDNLYRALVKFNYAF